MANLFFGVKGATLDLRQDLQIADTDAPRIIGYLMNTDFGKVTENVKNGDTQAWVTRQATPEETAANYARSILSQLLSATVQFEKAQAAAAAAASITPIETIG